MENNNKELRFRSGYFYRMLKGEYNPFRPNRVIITSSYLEYKKRNWHLVSVDSRKYHFQNVAGFILDKHLIGASIIIESTGDKSIYVHGLSKGTAKKIAAACSEYVSANTQKGTTEALADAIAAATKGSGGGQTSVADELKKMKGLLDDGIISQEEFDEQKKKLMSQ